MHPTGPLGAFTDAAVDLLLGSACVICRTPGRPLCPACRTRLPAAPPCPPTPTTGATGEVPVAAGPYDTALRALVVAHKERAVRSLAGPLGDLLATAVLALLEQHRADPATTVLLVPVPSRAASTRARGHDPTRRLVQHAALALREHGRDAHLAPLLRQRSGVRDQGGLGAEERAANLDRAMTVHPRELRRAAGRARPARPVHLVVCDDVTTTGATLREAARALRAVGARPLGSAVVAATPLRGRPA